LPRATGALPECSAFFLAMGKNRPVSVTGRPTFMRHRGSTSAFADTPAHARGASDWRTLSRLFPYLWEYKWRVVAAIAFMLVA